MKYLLLAALVVTGSTQAGTEKEERRAANWLVGAGGMATVNEHLGEQTIQRVLDKDSKEAPKERTLEDLKRNNPQGYKWFVGIGMRGALLQR